MSMPMMLSRGASACTFPGKCLHAGFRKNSTRYDRRVMFSLLLLPLASSNFISRFTFLQAFYGEFKQACDKGMLEAHLHIDVSANASCDNILCTARATECYFICKKGHSYVDVCL
jgi:hypothetical protein